MTPFAESWERNREEDNEGLTWVRNVYFHFWQSVNSAHSLPFVESRVDGLDPQAITENRKKSANIWNKQRKFQRFVFIKSQGSKMKNSSATLLEKFQNFVMESFVERNVMLLHTSRRSEAEPSFERFSGRFTEQEPHIPQTHCIFPVSLSPNSNKSSFVFSFCTRTTKICMYALKSDSDFVFSSILQV